MSFMVFIDSYDNRVLINTNMIQTAHEVKNNNGDTLVVLSYDNGDKIKVKSTFLEVANELIKGSK
jgi:hypothetical protein